MFNYTFSAISIKKETWVEPMKCHRCSHEWNYSGKNESLFSFNPFECKNSLYYILQIVSFNWYLRLIMLEKLIGITRSDK